MSRTIRAVEGEQLGPPENYALVDRPYLSPGPGKVSVAVQAAGVTFVDALVAAGGYQMKPPLPFRPGAEFAGVVDAIGEGVTRVAVGDRVCGAYSTGALAEQTIADELALARVPAEMPTDQAATFLASFTTVYHALVQRGRLEAGETVLVLGAGGAIGLAAVQLAKALGGIVIASASTAEKRALALESGADHAIDARAADWRDQVKALSNGRGVDIVLDPVSGAGMEPAFRSLAWGGRHLVIGFTSGEIARLPTNLPLLKGASLVGVDVRQFRLRDPDAAARNVARLFELYGDHRFETRITSRYPIERFADALREAASGKTAGRVVVDVLRPDGENA